MKLWIYEFKKRKSQFVMLVAGAVLFLIGFLLRRNFSGILVAGIQFFNSNEYILKLFGFEQPVTSITYTDVMMIMLSILAVFWLYHTMSVIAGSIRKERKMGTMEFFKTQGIATGKIYVIKLLISIVFFLLQLIVWYFIIRRISIYGVEKVEFITDITTKQLQTRMLYLGAAGIIMLGTGFIYGVASDRRKASILPDIMGFMILFAILPMVLNVINWAIQKNGVDTAWLENIVGIVKKIDGFNPVYFSNPFVVLTSWRLG